MKTIVLGSGGREHVIAYMLQKSPSVSEVYIAPGNGGTNKNFKNIDIEIKPPFDSLINFVKKENIDLVVVGPEAYLVEGIVDALSLAGVKAFGPNQAAAKLEGSKEFAKKIMEENDVPTADYKIFKTLESAKKYIESKNPPYVLKANGLASGKGVVITSSKEDAIDALQDYFVNNTFGDAGQTLVIESFLSGQEASILAFTDGKSVKLLTPSQDHKRAFDGDRGPNTGGMGVYTPVKILSKEHIQQIENKVLLPTIHGLAKRGIVYKGILYAGLMIDGDDINVVEFNCRFGDPEAECVLPLLKSDLAKVMLACIDDNLHTVNFELENKAGCTVILASGGYPKAYEKGYEIQGLDEVKGVEVFHAGTLSKNDSIVTNGGRVLAVTAYDQSLSGAITKVYQEIKKIHFKDIFYRKDIGKKGL